MKLTPVKQWICDECNEIIKKPEDGWLEWEDSQGKKGNFRIVHHKTASPKAPHGDCYMKNKPVGDMHLHQFCGDDGLSALLTMFSDVEKPDELVDIIRRLHTPSYEEAKLYWSDAQDGGYFDSANEVSPYLQKSLEGLIKRYGKGY